MCNDCERVEFVEGQRAVVQPDKPDNSNNSNNSNNTPSSQSN